MLVGLLLPTPSRRKQKKKKTTKERPHAIRYYYCFCAIDRPSLLVVERNGAPTDCKKEEAIANKNRTVCSNDLLPSTNQTC